MPIDERIRAKPTFSVTKREYFHFYIADKPVE
jgi:hypothetical protein